jgi:hypothetical protein
MLNRVEKLIVALWCFAAICAAYGAFMLAGPLDRTLLLWQIGSPIHPDYVSKDGFASYIAIAMFIFVIIIAFRGVEDMRKEREKKEERKRSGLV